MVLMPNSWRCAMIETSKNVPRSSRRLRHNNRLQKRTGWTAPARTANEPIEWRCISHSYMRPKILRADVSTGPC